MRLIGPGALRWLRTVLGGEVAVPCNPRTALAGLNPLVEGRGLRGQCCRWRRRWLGSRAVDAREPGQVREEAALSGSVHAMRGSPTGASSRRRARVSSLDAGCTVHLRD